MPFIKTSKCKLMLFRLFSIPNAYCPGMDLKLSIKKTTVLITSNLFNSFHLISKWKYVPFPDHCNQMNFAFVGTVSFFKILIHL